MSVKTFKRRQVNDPTVDNNFRDLETSINSVASNPLSGALWIAPIAFTSGVAKIISHGLATAYTSIIPAVPTGGNATFQQGTSPDRTKYVVITASANCTCGFLIF